MRIQFSRIRIFAGVLLLLLVAALAFPAAAQQAQRNPDGSVNPTASAVNEQKLLQTLGQIDGRVSIPAQRAGVLIQPAGREWRDFHEVTLRIIGAVAIIGMLALLVIFYLWRGMVRLEAGRSGRTLVRFNAFERGVHWMTATCFVILAISGLNITFGRPLLLPLLGPETFTAWSQWAKYAHNFLSFPFTLGVVLIFLMWIAGNIPNRVDFQWLKAGGGIVGQEHPPAQRFNAGQKLIYWIVVLGGGAAASGLPQKPQSRNFAGFASPHDGQTTLSYVGRRRRLFPDRSAEMRELFERLGIASTPADLRRFGGGRS